MFRINVFFLVILIISALGVVNAQHTSRKLFMALENEKQIERKLDIEWGKLQLEQSTLIMHGRIESIAREHLNMIIPPTSAIQIVTIETAPAGVDSRLNRD
ncbi:cell division protein FtsL [Nitrosomonas sp. PY1]|uniref:cell division protein FtsL n=1 Tax=Nitrosomonas sp. PY1 TaxID=1803906 RepID=UPI001FC807C1|nr:cell division protein FtsL [Nitrosomonas sp. PY1]GKS68125.1 cell division protein FtsL [Nitrosomonas sp. PY1]